MKVSLLIPGLFDLPPDDQTTHLHSARLPALEKCLARSQRSPFGRFGLAASLFEIFGLRVDAHRDLPVGAVSYLADSGKPATGFCLRADPVHLIPHRDQLVLLGPESLGLSEAEAKQLAEELNRHFFQDGWRLETPTSGRWYLHLPEASELRSYEPEHVQGRAIGDFLPGGVQGKFWQGVMNEVQMLLHVSSVNLQRQAEGRRAVSSLWFWGGGELPNADGEKLIGKTFDVVCSDEPLARGLAMHTGITLNNLPESATDLINHGLAESNQLLVLDQVSRAMQVGHDAWWEAVQDLERHWMVPLLMALREKKLSGLNLYDTRGQCFSLDSRGLRRWWRQSKPLVTYSAVRD